MRLLVYALGGGLGHLQRSLALGRAAVARGHGVEILSNSPAWPRIAGRAGFDGITVRHLVGEPDSILAQVQQRIATPDAHDILVVDTLPRGIAGELDALDNRDHRVAKVFVHRDLDARYACRPEVIRAAKRFDLVLGPGEIGPLVDHLDVTPTAPWLLLDAAELLDPAAARSRLGHDNPARPLVVIADSTDPVEARGLDALARRWTTELDGRATVDRVDLERTWPLLRCHRGIDLLIGAGGYNTVMEARATNTPFRGIARCRLYDSQDRRLAADEVLEGSPGVRLRDRNATANYDNGAHAAVRRIEGLT